MKTIKVRDIIKVNPNKQPTNPNLGKIYKVLEVPLGENAIIQLSKNGRSQKKWILKNMMKVGEKYAKE